MFQKIKFKSHGTENNVSKKTHQKNQKAMPQNVIALLKIVSVTSLMLALATQIDIETDAKKYYWPRNTFY